MDIVSTMIGDNGYLIGKNVITKDAYILGEIQDYSCETISWDIIGLKVKSTNSVAPLLDIGSGRSMILLQPDDFTMNEVVLSEDTIESIRSKVTADNSDYLSVGSMIGMNVYASDGLLVGTIESFEVDFSKWKVISMRIKLDKSAHQPLGVKKILFGKRIGGILMSQIDGMKDSVILSLDTDSIRDQMIIL